MRKNKKLKKANKELRKDIDVLLKGSFVDKTIIQLKYQTLEQLENSVWYGTPTIIGKIMPLGTKIS